MAEYPLSVSDVLREMTLSSVSLVTFTIAAVFVCLRVYVRIRRRVTGWDDYLICVALVRLAASNLDILLFPLAQYRRLYVSCTPSPTSTRSPMSPLNTWRLFSQLSDQDFASGALLPKRNSSYLPVL